MKYFELLERCALAGLVVLLSTAAAAAVAVGIPDPAERPAAALSASQQPALLDITRAGDRLVAVGERGVILVSSDHGKTWTQASVPVAVTLTAVRFVTARKGWAVGHSGVILQTTDGGDSWVRQFDGVKAAEAVLRVAQADTTEGAEKRLALARQFVSDGADKPFLALTFENELRGVIVGAYGLVFGTEDGGVTWTPWLDRVPNPKGLHLNAVHREGQALYIAGEQGLFVRSHDGGRTFLAVETPYRGSYFTLLASSPGQLVLGGLRGNAYRFDTEGGSFQKLEVPNPVTLSSSTRLPDGRLMFINQAGQWLVGAADALRPVAGPAGAPAIAAVATADGALALATWRGAVRAALPQVAGAAPAQDKKKEKP